eukprot:CAMPEP_0181106358 /NCGR_PEP_ID=MMETSP1071-20121207/16489_1 /TAXON_ID=35127 /ORGANISM="Thalassiosira sp., Strain NH16" /LENGTH=142 /DNA_ID=CAMNT_0023189759 /DNA_START=87 /DNA_END=515 /DNA_ORIENTATION=+
MKLSIVILTALLSTAEAFAPAQQPHSIIGKSALFGVAGDEIRDARPTYALHGTGEIGSVSRSAPRGIGNKDAIIGSDIHHARPTYAAHGTGEIGSVSRSAPMANGSRESMIGSDIHHARPTYAAHGTGEIGSDARVPFVPQR